MSYKANTTIPPNNLYGNPTGSPATGSGIALAGYTSFTRNLLSATAGPGRDTSGDTTLVASDDGTTLISTDGGQAILFLPAGLRRGFKVRSFQGGPGSIFYIPSGGATIANGSIKSAGNYANQIWVDIENIGGDQWVLTNGGVSTGGDTWSIAGMPTIQEGDACTFIIHRPAVANSNPSGSAIVVTGTGFSSAGFARNLVETMTDLAAINPNVTFDGVNTLTIKPGSINPIALSFFAVPTYTAIGNRDVTITISSPSAGSLGTAAFTTTIVNVSKPTDPSLLFPASTAVVHADAAGSQSSIVLESVTGLIPLMTVMGDPGIPAQTYILSINTSTKTVILNANLTGTVAATTSLTFTPPGIWFDFSSTTGMTKDGSNRVATVTDLVNGYTINQSSSGAKPIYAASVWNGKSGLQFDGVGQTLAAGSGFSFNSSALVNPADTSVTMASVSGIVTGQQMMVPAASPGIFKVTGISGSVVSFTPAMPKTVASGTPFVFYGATDPLPIIALSSAPNPDISSTRFFVMMKTSDVPLGNPFFGTFLPQTQAGDIHLEFPEIDYSVVANQLYCWTDWNGLGSGMCNGQRNWTRRVTTTADLAAGGTLLNVDDTSSVRIRSNVRVHLMSNVSGGFQAFGGQGVNSPTQLGVSAIGQPIPAGTSVSIQGGAVGNGRPSFTSAINGNFQIGDNGTFHTGAFTVCEFIYIPRMLSPQELNGVHQYIANKWGQTFTATVSSNVAASADTNLRGGPAWRIPLASLTGVAPGQVISAATGVSEGTCVVGVSSSNGNIEVDVPISSPGITSGTAITFTTPGFKKPTYMDVRQYDLIYRDDFSNGINITNDGNGWTVNEGSFFNYPYNNTAHGYIDFATFYPDVTYAPWAALSPYSTDKPVGAESGEMVMTLIPTPPAMAAALASIGQSQTAMSGLPTNQQSFRIMHGYIEARMKIDHVSGSWPAFWLTAARDQPIFGAEWPPEIDILENQGVAPSGTNTTLWSQNPNGGQYGNGSGDQIGPVWQQYMLIGCELTSDAVSIYINRELVRRYPTLYDTNTFWCINFDNNINGWDGVTPINMYVDYVAAWRKKAQTPTVSGTTQAETTALLAAMSVQPSSPRTTLINTLIASLKTFKTAAGQSFWDALDFLYLPAAHDAQAGRINWKNPAQVGTVVGSPTFQTDRGYTGNIGTSYIDTGVALATATLGMTQLTNHIGAVINGVSGAPQSTTVGSVGSPNFLLQPTNTGEMIAKNLSTKLWDTTILSSGVAPNTVPLNQITGNSHLISVRNVYKCFAYVNGQYGTCYGFEFTTTQTGLDASHLLIANSNYQTACFHGGKFLTADDARDLYTILYNYLHALGAL